jgi:hypothetical protein
VIDVGRFQEEPCYLSNVVRVVIYLFYSHFSSIDVVSIGTETLPLRGRATLTSYVTFNDLEVVYHYTYSSSIMFSQ